MSYNELFYRDTFQSLSYTIPTTPTTVSIGQKRSKQHQRGTTSKRMVLDDRLSWPALLRADNKGTYLLMLLTLGLTKDIEMLHP